MNRVDITKQLEMVLYKSENNDVTVNVIIKDETIWITQKAMAELLLNHLLFYKAPFPFALQFHFSYNSSS